MKNKIIIGLLIFILPFIVLANNFNEITMDIYIDNNGNAKVVEEWDVSLTSGTEGYKAFYKTGGIIIDNFKVSFNNRVFDNVRWNVNDSFNDKAYKSGIVSYSDSYELCFGISEYGRKNKYRLEYNIKNFVMSINDADIVYMTLIPTNMGNNYSYIKIYSDFKYNNEWEIWGYGNYGGTAYFSNGYIEASKENLDDSEYMTYLIKFPKGTFNTNNKGYNDFDYYLNMANEDSESYKEKSNSFAAIISILISFGFTILVGFLVTKGIRANGYGFINNKKIDKKNVLPFRDIPCKGDIYKMNALIKINNFGYKESNIIGAVLLKWLNNDMVSVVKDKGIFTDKTSILLKDGLSFDNDFENKLYSYFIEASRDNKLESKEMKKWCEKNYSKIKDILDDRVNESITELISDNLIRNRINKEECKYNNVMVDELYFDSTYLYGSYKFLKDLSNIKDKSSIEVKLWDKYLMIAYLFSIADKVMKEFKDLFPEVIEEMNYDYNTFYIINSFSNDISKSISVAEARARNYSSGGGGFSSSGGGGGSFGSSGGGFR